MRGRGRIDAAVDPRLKRAVWQSRLMRKPQEIANELSASEAWQLKRIGRGRHADAEFGGPNALIDTLIAQGLVERLGGAVYLTWLGHAVLGALQ